MVNSVTDQSMDQTTDRQSDLWSRVYATFEYVVAQDRQLEWIGTEEVNRDTGLEPEET